jgi:hypothetical protein
MPTPVYQQAAQNERKAMRDAQIAEHKRRVIKFADGERTADELALFVGCSSHMVKKWAKEHGLKLGRKK